MSEHLKLEELMIFALKRDFKPDKANSYITRYFAIKHKLYTDFLSWIRANEPMLTDHGPDHIDDVLDNAYKLLEKEFMGLINNDASKSKYQGIDLYILCMSILFHDVGNFFQREFHNQNIQIILNDLFSQFFYGDFKREKNHIITVGRAHAGKNVEGGNDTLIGIDEINNCGRDEVQLRDIAAIVRLADELAEGPQRTCQYMSLKEKITPKSEIYHRYAGCTQIGIDAKNGCINLTYEIELNLDKNNNMSKPNRNKLKKFLEFIYGRIFKLDQERKYCGFYCDALKSIKKTRVSFNFLSQGYFVDFKLNPLILTDLTIPGDKTKSIIEGRDDLKIDFVINELARSLSSMSFHPKVSEKTVNYED